MRKNTEKILFYLVPVFCIILFVSSGETIIPYLERTFIAKYLYSISYANSIAFNLSIGYLSGIFIYYLTGYIPAKKREKEQDIITTRLLNQIKSSINSLFRTILKCSTKQIDNMVGIDAERFKGVCKNCNLNTQTDSKKIISYNPLKFGDVLLRESLISKWNVILSHLSEIDNASIYIKPKHYDVCLSIKKCSLAYTIKELGHEINNTDLEAWSSQLYDLYMVSEKIDKIIDSIEVK
jgi:hypothetical protein